MARGEALMRTLSGGHPTGKVGGMARIDPQADPPKDDPKPDENDDAGNENDDDDGGEEQTPEEIRAERDRLKADAAKARTRAAREAKAKKDAERAAAKESEGDEALKKQLAAAEKDNADLRDKLIRSGIRAAAAKAGAVDPGVVARLIDVDSLVDPTDEDEVEEAVQALLEEKQYLKKAKKTKTDAGKGGEGSFSGSTDFNAIIRRAKNR